MRYESIKALAKHHKQAFGRIVKCEMYDLSEGKLLALSRFHDDYHDMNLAILLDGDYRITEIGARMDRIPYPQCETKPVDTLSALKGIPILEKGGFKAVRERIPRNLGCTHLYEMIESTFRAVFVGRFGLLGKQWEGILSLDMEENRQVGMQSPLLADTCYAFHTGSADEAALGRARRKMKAARKVKEAIEAVKRGE